MKRFMFFALVAVFLLATQVPGFAQAAPKIAYVNLSRIFDEYQNSILINKIHRSLYEQTRDVHMV